MSSIVYILVKLKKAIDVILAISAPSRDSLEGISAKLDAILLMTWPGRR